jgi:hypothetical protein
MSSDLYSQIMNSRGSFERMLGRLPGFAGYLDRNARRAADRMLRDHLAQKIEERIRRLAAIERKLIDRGGIGHMPKTQSAKTKLQTYHDRLKAAAPGYSGFFDAVKIDAEALDHLYGFDELQVIYVDRLDEALEALESAVDGQTGVEAAIEQLDSLAREANEAFSKRESALLNLGISK